MCSVSLSAQDLIEEMRQRLTRIGYYRLSAYWYPFRKSVVRNGETVKTDNFRRGTTWENVIDYYHFDRRLRNMIFEAISRIEIALRAAIARRWAEDTGIPNPQGVKNCYRRSYDTFEESLRIVNGNYRKSTSDAAQHYRVEKGIKETKDLPVWVFVEFSTFGDLNHLLVQGLKLKTQRAILSEMGFENAEFGINALRLLRVVRNVCAHQGRIWNRFWETTQGKPCLHVPVDAGIRSDAGLSVQCGQVDMKRTALVLVICVHILSHIAPKSQWRERLCGLIERASNPSLYKDLGFLFPNWRNLLQW